MALLLFPILLLLPIGSVDRLTMKSLRTAWYWPSCYANVIPMTSERLKEEEMKVQLASRDKEVLMQSIASSKVGGNHLPGEVFLVIALDDNREIEIDRLGVMRFGSEVRTLSKKSIDRIDALFLRRYLKFGPGIGGSSQAQSHRGAQIKSENREGPWDTGSDYGIKPH